MTQEEEIELLERQNEFLLEHGTDLTLKKGEFCATLYFQSGKYQTKTTKEETKLLIGIEEPGILFVNRNLIPELKTKTRSETIPDIEIL